LFDQQLPSVKEMLILSILPEGKAFIFMFFDEEQSLDTTDPTSEGLSCTESYKILIGMVMLNYLDRMLDHSKEASKFPLSMLTFSSTAVLSIS
jgi:hypothetical protein